MAIIDPKPPTRQDLEVMCGGNQRLVKAFEQMFALIPKELNNLDGSNTDAQIVGESATAQALAALACYEMLNQIVELLISQPPPVCNCQPYQDLSVRNEQVQENLILSPAQVIEPDNLYFEVT
ncbi:hypothetical protein [Acinetobacter nosocomialis]|uniref:hypothetical protein n=1 Tax=Acinetobacter nosocomialis TaxID=106654 RepID=UPI0006683D42|nr:hypothetical protein [Acinetobacter nosocomialis]